MTDKSVNASDLEGLLRWAGLDLPREEQAELAPYVGDLTTMVTALNAVDAKELAPQCAFDPRWRARLERRSDPDAD